MQHVAAHIDCQANSVVMAPRLLKKLGTSQEAAHTTTLSLGGQIMQHVKECRKTSLTVQYKEHLAQLQNRKWRSYWWEPTIDYSDDCSSGPGTRKLFSNLRRSTAWRSPNGPLAADLLGEEDKLLREAQDKLPERGGDTSTQDISFSSSYRIRQSLI